MALDPQLVEILACPQDKGPLYYVASRNVLYNPRLHLSYDVRDDIPVMLASEVSHLDDAAHDELMAVVESEGIQLNAQPAA